MSKTDTAERSRKRLNLTATMEDGIRIEVAQSFSDLEQAFQLAYSAYLDKGYMTDQVHKIRINKHLLLPNSATIVAKKNHQVVGCVSVVCEEVMGIPSSSIFDISPLRRNNLRIVEATSMAVAPKMRSSNGALFFSLLKYLFHFSQNFCNADLLFAAVNPRQEGFYKNIMLFEDVRFLDTKPSPHANLAPAVPLILDLKNWKSAYFHIYGGREEKSNLYHSFFLKEEPSHFYPDETYFVGNDQLLSAEKLEHFLKIGTGVLDEPNSKDFAKFSSIYASPVYDSVFQRTTREEPRIQRFLSSMPVLFHSEHRRIPGLAINVSKKGMAVLVSSKTVPVDYSGLYTVSLGSGKVSRVQAEVIWQKEVRHGLQITNDDFEWSKMLQFFVARSQGGAPSIYQKKSA